jgi:hypothetical protein
MTPYGTPDVFGTLGHRTGLGIYLAMLIPLGFLTSYGPWLAGIYGVGLLLSKSNVAVLAGAAGFLCVEPTIWWAAVPAAVVGFTYRSVEWNTGHPQLRHWGDTWRARWLVWRTVWDRLQPRWRPWPAFLIGNGAMSFALDCRTWATGMPPRPVMHLTGEIFREAHNDYVEHAYEYGLLGCLAMAGWLWTLRGAFHLHDAVTGSAVALGIAMLGSFPLRVAPLLGVASLVAILLMRRIA